MSELFKNIKGSLKAVILNFREYAGIFAAILLVQTIFGIFVFSAFTNSEANDKLFGDAYDYDVKLVGNIGVVESMMSNDLIRQKYTGMTAYRVEGNDTIYVDVDPSKLEYFSSQYGLSGNKNITVEVSPRYTYFTEVKDNINTFSVYFGIFLLLFNIVLLAVIYNIRASHFQFLYGLYATFGADKLRLYETALGELCSIGAVLFIPSLLLSYLISLAIYLPQGIWITLNFWQLPLLALLNVIVIAVACIVPIFKISVKTPMSLINAKDNADLVSSPKRSFDLLKYSKYPKSYELLSLRRYKKYFITLTLSAVCFSAVFMSGLYIAKMIGSVENSSAADIILNTSYAIKVDEDRELAYEDAEFLLSELYDIEGVDAVRWESSVNLSSKMDHVLLKPSMLDGSAGDSVPYNGSLRDAGYTRAYNKAKYVSLDAATLKMYEKLYDVEYLDGYSAESVLDMEDVIVVSESIYGDKMYSFNTGDKIYINEFLKVREGREIPKTSNNKNLLRGQLENCSFIPEEYTVGAVIRGPVTGDRLILGLPYDSYMQYADNVKPAIEQIRVYLDDSLDLDQIQRVREEVKNVTHSYTGYIAEITDEAVYAIAQRRAQRPVTISVISWMILLASPIVLIFSQFMFYKNRRREFALLKYMGSSNSDIGRIHTIGGMALSILSFVSNFGICYLVCYLVYMGFSRVLPSFGVIDFEVVFSNYISPETVLLCAVVSGVCGMLACIIPYFYYRKFVANDEESAILSGE